MTIEFVARTLSFEYDRQAIQLDAESAIHDSRLQERPLVVLGGAGSGKSELLKLWSNDSAATARQLINGRRLTKGRVFIDGLDEAAGLRDGDALDQLLGKLEAERNSNFVIACRVADWRSASGKGTIKRWTGSDPIEITIDPLSRKGVASFLMQHSGVAQQKAEEFISDYEERGLTEWLGNPQTLLMLARLLENGKRPDTVKALFEQYVDVAWREPRKQNTALANVSRENALDVLGALFAALIIGGYDALSLAPGSKHSESDLRLGDCKVLPGLATNELRDFLDSRLITGVGEDRFAYQHRRVGEYLGASWLARQAKSQKLRNRLLGALQLGEQVPSNLRGLWGWLADEPTFADDVIRADPIAVIEYGNADTLPAQHAKTLLAALERAEEDHAQIGWRRYNARSILLPALSTDVERILAAPKETRFQTQFVVLQQMRDAEVVARHEATLQTIVFDTERPYALRDAAADALASHGSIDDWRPLVQKLSRSDDRDSLRLALNLMLHPNIGLILSDSEFVETVFAYSGLTPRFDGETDIGTISLYHLRRDQVIPDLRLDGVLDTLAKCARQYVTDEWHMEAWDVEHLFLDLFKRRVILGNVDPSQLWNWIKQPLCARSGGRSDRLVWLQTWLKEHPDVRRAIQCEVLDESVEDSRQMHWRFHKLGLGLHPTTEEVIYLLDWLPEGDQRWTDLIWLAPTGEEGLNVRQAAARHVRAEDDQKLLQSHANPQPPRVDEGHLKWQRKQASAKKKRRDEHRKSYLDVRDRMLAGDGGALRGPAQVYMGRVYEGDRDLPPEERIAAWVGEDLQADALQGFEAFLTADPPHAPNAQQIADSYAKSRIWHHALIWSAALAERQRTGRGFGDLSTERLQAGLLAERAAFLDDNNWMALCDAIVSEIECRGAWADTARLFIEPQLREQSGNVLWLWRVLNSSEGTKLAAEWLLKFPDLAADPEETLIDHLLRDGSTSSRAALIEVAAKRSDQDLETRRQQNWQAVELILGTAKPALLDSMAQDRNPIWILRDRMGGRHGNSSIRCPAMVLAAIVRTFAPLWPWTPRPRAVTHGDRNSWDATDFLENCVNILAADPSQEATTALMTLTDIGDGYASKIGRAIAYQRRARADAEWQPYKVDALAKLITEGPAVDHADLQRMVLADLADVERKIKSSPADVWRFFYANATELLPYEEEKCSNALFTLLEKSDHNIEFGLEEHLGDDREGDIWCTSNSISIAIECKRHWHPDLWTAVDWQLAKQQAVDWRAQGHGIYVVYWFGMHVQTVTGPPRGSGIKAPTSAQELENALRQQVSKAGLPDIAVKVLDVSRPPK
ncbi:hypothetical protein [Rhizobium sp. CSW-27]|uniref:NACHT domain-containing protein n=1 Tax=Rhizobium sp. CSW-27 TaxID=2839985 RepID=UPI001C03639A|nr:hypothetical protein [Rhizobium sp. CSW-27]MBT9373123.1 hypothetical protein [Rhizobium sp. CSW-27]